MLWLSFNNIPDGVTSVGAHAFYNCTSLTEIIIPGEITSIDSDPFGLCNADLIFYTSTPAIIETNSFETFAGEIFVFYSNLNTYKEATNWLNYSEIIKPLTPTSEFTFDKDSKTIISYNHTYVAGELEYYQQVIIPDTFHC